MLPRSRSPLFSPPRSDRSRIPPPSPLRLERETPHKQEYVKRKPGSRNRSAKTSAATSPFAKLLTIRSRIPTKPTATVKQKTTFVNTPIPASKSTAAALALALVATAWRAAPESPPPIPNETSVITPASTQTPAPSRFYFHVSPSW